MLSRFEIEGAPLGENSVESEEDEEEVWLFWKDNNKEIRSKSIRELAQDAKEGQKEDQEVISYYRYLLDLICSSGMTEVMAPNSRCHGFRTSPKSHLWR